MENGVAEFGLDSTFNPKPVKLFAPKWRQSFHRLHVEHNPRNPRFKEINEY
jgi:hypothetical protein